MQQTLLTTDFPSRVLPPLLSSVGAKHFSFKLGVTSDLVGKRNRYAKPRIVETVGFQWILNSAR
jgi:hypothetical protein